MPHSSRQYELERVLLAAFDRSPAWTTESMVHRCRQHWGSDRPDRQPSRRTYSQAWRRIAQALNAMSKRGLLSKSEPRQHAVFLEMRIHTWRRAAVERSVAGGRERGGGGYAPSSASTRDYELQLSFTDTTNQLPFLAGGMKYV